MDDFDKDMVRAVYEQLMETSRKQDDLVHSWTKFYLTIQAGLAVALSFLVRLDPAHGFVVNAGSMFVPLLGIATSHYLTNIILREQMWQGRYIAQIRRLPQLPETYREPWVSDEPDPEKRSYIGKQFGALRRAVIAGWMAWLVLAVSHAGCGRP